MRVAVVDASALVELLLGTEAGRSARRLLRGRVCAAPAHMDAEVLSALGRHWRAGLASAEAVAGRLDALARMPIARYPLAPLLRYAWALRDNIAQRDGLYVALAHSLDAQLVTADRRLGAVARGVEVVVLGES